MAPANTVGYGCDNGAPLHSFMLRNSCINMPVRIVTSAYQGMEDLPNSNKEAIVDPTTGEVTHCRIQHGTTVLADDGSEDIPYDIDTVGDPSPFDPYIPYMYKYAEGPTPPLPTITVQSQREPPPLYPWDEETARRILSESELKEIEKSYDGQFIDDPTTSTIPAWNAPKSRLIRNADKYPEDCKLMMELDDTYIMSHNERREIARSLFPKGRKFFCMWDSKSNTRTLLRRKQPSSVTRIIRVTSTPKEHNGTLRTRMYIDNETLASFTECFVHDDDDKTALTYITIGPELQHAIDKIRDTCRAGRGTIEKITNMILCARIFNCGIRLNNKMFCPSSKHYQPGLYEKIKQCFPGFMEMIRNTMKASIDISDIDTGKAPFPVHMQQSNMDKNYMMLRSLQKMENGRFFKAHGINHKEMIRRDHIANEISATDSAYFDRGRRKPRSNAKKEKQVKHPIDYLKPKEIPATVGKKSLRIRPNRDLTVAYGPDIIVDNNA